jgi:alginate O-acetyltransferase complex protein AlgI
MNFISLEFLLFLVGALLAYYLCPKRFRWGVLLVASLLFYALTDWRYLLFLLVLSGLAYGLALAIEQLKAKKHPRWARLVLLAGIFLFLGGLIACKYVTFLLDGLNAIRAFFQGAPLALENILLPLGLSFYLFQALAYLIDCYRGVATPEKNPLKFVLFIAYFPHLLQGPIERYNDLMPQLVSGHDFSSDSFEKGGERIALGFLKKIAIADVLSPFVSAVLLSHEQGGVLIGVLLLVYAVQLYCDFSGYIDIALGVSDLFGISLKENFKMPYLSESISEFWRRWHITLGSWFRDYVYYPILLSKPGKKIMASSKKAPSVLWTCLALVVVWLCMGLWHGASLNYLFYGAYHGVLIILEFLLAPLRQRFYRRSKIDSQTFPLRVYRVIRTFLLVCFGYVFFFTDDLSLSFSLVGQLFSSFNPWLLFDGTLDRYGLTFYSFLEVALALLILLFRSPLFAYREEAKRAYFSEEATLNKQLGNAMLVIAICLGWLLLYRSGDYTSAFVYFEF